MTSLLLKQVNHARLGAFASGRLGLYAFAATLLMSASLLFSVQPLFAKIVLPHLGGSPSVWAVCMCFFQAALLAGYCYAHGLNRFVAARWTPIIHLAVCTAAVFALPFGLPAWAHEAPTGNIYFWLIGVLAIGVGLPFFAVAANAPLLQAWFSRSGHPDAADPYFLYGASNLGSLASLLAYPFIIEPLMGVDTQRAIWTAGFVALMLMLAACGVLMLAGLTQRDEARGADGAMTDGASANTGATDAASEPTARDRLTWIALAFIPSALLVAFTTHITTDIASAPFLWVLPLATFLGTFVIVFRDRSLLDHAMVLRLHPIFAAIALLFVVVPHAGGAIMQGVVAFTTFLLTTLVAHRTLYDARPSADRLTEFYLYMSLGGVLGGMFAALIAPQLFNSVAEYPLLIIAGLFARPGIVAAMTDPERRTPAAILGGGVLAISLGLAATGLMKLDYAMLIAVGALSATIIGAFLDRMDRAWTMGTAGALAAMFVAGGAFSGDSYSERSFFGVSRVALSDDGQYKVLAHGSTLHGSERLLDDAGKPIEWPVPVTYYYPGSPMALGFKEARWAARNTGAPMDVAVVGLGAGALACHKTGDERITFYEIDPVVDHIARTPEHFRYLTKCAPDAETKLGDARLTLAKDPKTIYDLLVIDAFSSDAVPVHLLTQEALELYISKIEDHGLVVFHISNRYLELESVVAATAARIEGMHLVFVNDRPDTDDHLAEMPSHVMFLTRNKALAERIMTWDNARPADARETIAWTDDYADIISAIWRKYSAPTR